MRLRIALGLGLLIVLTVVGACSGQKEDDQRPRVIVTTSILGDVVGRIGEDAINLEVLIPPGIDPHDYSPSAQQVALISGASLVVANGLGLEEGLIDVLEQARSEGISVLDLGPELEPMPSEEGFDPHFWQDPDRMVIAVALLASRLINDAGLDPQHTSETAAAYALEVEEANIEAERLLNEVPADRRIMITNHDAFGYFAERYGFEIVGTIIPGGSTLGHPSSADLAKLVDLIAEHDLPAIFVENVGDGSLAASLAAETGRDIAVVELISDALGESGSSVDSYVEMILFNAHAVANALR